MSNPVQSKGGAGEFLARLDTRHRVWAFVAAEAPVGMVSGAVADELGQAVFFENATCRPAATIKSDSAPEVMATDWVAIVKPKESPWAFAFLALAPRAPHFLGRLFPLAQELAETLGTRAFAARRDEAGEIECHLYDSGELVEEVAFVPGGPLRIFRSSRREAPKTEVVELALFGELCAGLGILVPAGFPAVRADEAFFSAEQDQQIERVDLLLPPAPAEDTMVFEEDETVIFQASDFDAPETLPEAPRQEAERGGGWGMKAILGRLFGRNGKDD